METTEINKEDRVRVEHTVSPTQDEQNVHTTTSEKKGTHHSSPEVRKRKRVAAGLPDATDRQHRRKERLRDGAGVLKEGGTSNGNS